MFGFLKFCYHDIFLISYLWFILFLESIPSCPFMLCWEIISSKIALALFSFSVCSAKFLCITFSTVSFMFLSVLSIVFPFICIFFGFIFHVTNFFFFVPNLQLNHFWVLNFSYSCFLLKFLMDFYIFANSVLKLSFIFLNRLIIVIWKSVFNNFNIWIFCCFVFLFTFFSPWFSLNSFPVCFEFFTECQTTCMKTYQTSFSFWACFSFPFLPLLNSQTGVDDHNPVKQ